MKLQIIFILIMLLATILAAVGSIFMKKGSAVLNKKRSLLFKNPSTLVYLVMGLTLYGLGAILNIIAYKGGDYLIIFPLTSLAYIWSLILSRIILGEKITRFKIVGTAVIIAGILVLLW
ncbi:MAG: EamA family transporter [Candidatus Nanoarchaeia archaeon]